MEDWELDFQWLKVKHFLKDKFNKSELPDLNAILFLIGIQELGQLKRSLQKKKNKTLCILRYADCLSEDGYYEFEGMDTAGCLIGNLSKHLTNKGVKAQSTYLKEKVIHYFASFFEEEE